MSERQEARPINPIDKRDVVVVDPIKQQLKAAIDAHDEAAISRLNHVLRVDPMADLPGENTMQEGLDRAAIERMVSEGSPEPKVH